MNFVILLFIFVDECYHSGKVRKTLRCLPEPELFCIDCKINSLINLINANICKNETKLLLFLCVRFIVLFLFSLFLDYNVNMLLHDTIKFFKFAKFTGKVSIKCNK